MANQSTRNPGGLFGKRIARFFLYRKARRLYNEIARGMSFFEAKYLKVRLHHP